MNHKELTSDYNFVFETWAENYKHFVQKLGFSDIACLTMVGCRGKQGAVTEFLNFDGDGEYKAYLIDENTEVPAHYKKVAEFNHWLKIFDDYSLVLFYDADKIEVYRAGGYGVIIKGNLKKG